MTLSMTNDVQIYDNTHPFPYIYTPNAVVIDLKSVINEFVQSLVSPKITVKSCQDSTSTKTPTKIKTYIHKR